MVVQPRVVRGRVAMRKAIVAASVVTAAVGGVTAAVGVGSSIMAQQSQSPGSVPWNRCCGTGPWPMGRQVG